MIAKNDKEWHRLVIERENYICQGCGKDFSADYYFDENGKNQYVFGHHIKHKKQHPELRHETDNGACSCDSETKCHTKHHLGLLTYKQNTSTL